MWGRKHIYGRNSTTETLNFGGDNKKEQSNIIALNLNKSKPEPKQEIIKTEQLKETNKFDDFEAEYNAFIEELKAKQNINL